MRGVAETRGSIAPRGIHVQRRILLENLAVERRKLEMMIIDMFARGRENLGADPLVLEQSRRLDQLVVDEMLLEEILKSTD